MKLKKIIASCLSASLLLTAVPATVMAAPSVALESITWQDPENTVLSWKHFSGYTYEIYRADTSSGSYALIGTSDCGSYRDDTAVHPNKYYYKITINLINFHLSKLNTKHNSLFCIKMNNYPTFNISMQNTKFKFASTMNNYPSF